MKILRILELRLPTSACHPSAGESVRERSLLESVINQAVHDSRTFSEDTMVPRSLCLFQLRTVSARVSTFVDIIVIGKDTDILGPVKRLLGPRSIRVIAGVSCPTCSKEEKIATTERRLVVVTVHEGENFPA